MSNKTIRALRFSLRRGFLALTTNTTLTRGLRLTMMTMMMIVMMMIMAFTIVWGQRTNFVYNNQLSKFVGQTFQEVSERGGGLIVTHYFNIRSKLPQHHNYTEGNASNKQTNATNQSNNYHTLKRDQVLLGRELESVKCIWLIMHPQYV